MIGEVVYSLRAKNSTQLPCINGRLMHAAFFNVLNEFSPELGKFIHSRLNLKPFTVSFLNPAANIPSSGERWEIRRGDKFFWRVTGLNAQILQTLSNLSRGYEIRAGALTLSVENVNANIVAVADFISRCKNMSPVKELCLEFVSPVSFRIDDFDAPYPRAELIFASLADKWTQAEMPAVADKKIIRELAAQIRLTQWHGQSKKFYFGRDRGTLAFWGKFFYDLKALSEDVRKVFVLLAKFGEFSGVGRLTGQGFGQVRASY